jgi:apolipoprotein D and lipocalin family protein
MGNSSSSSLPALQTAASCETAKFMGTWFVIAVKPTIFEKTSSNAVEKYSLKKGESFDIDIDFQFNTKEPISSKTKSLPQKGYIEGENKADSSQWKVSPFWPIKAPYLILEVDEEYAHAVIGYPSRNYCWIMSRKPVMAEATYAKLTKQLVEKHQYNLDGLRKVPQVWTNEEREKRGLTQEEIPDALLQDVDK